ncbi:MAG: CamS family sex pheromone protein [Lactobacillus sp.]|jgi:protein involved in sex pheromone biosynthesis|uniref:CamS family sex pheromone protein n=1 Tax=Lacticaseibacillus suilingensis TaxID=2799577 RepID=A0ABW4BHM2_9LACO|nr:CamS family sex pheromone protein [Lacticaseibacillus suilingensis]MCI1893905.1 CamS family sex pheromone protein [Lactobacillus sp.]MCI1918054.1 CamS family sex pheromone protein [Lactobacillus sp.]MCI1941935.1 CamS family sex pheromone protein [Lactobacillus sp.]MCI2016699.1 CamS family sex pheromone protein [Lactobacillus sp.]MCI2038312.1 CamS family sex pheromone protein [Lactobacillus sp.]
MKKALTAALILVAAISLAACGKLSFDSGSGSSTSGSSKGYTTTGTVDSGMYEGVIQNGRYKTSSARGLQLSTNQQGGNSFNIKSMENGLQDIAKKQFSTSKYVFEEGQLISTSTAKKWLARKSDDSQGLNPKDNGKTGETERNPMYLETMVEQDYMTQSGSDMSLGGVAIALGMNADDYYQKEKYGATYTTHISDADMTTQGKAMAKEVVARVRKMSGVNNDTPIVIALYKLAGSDSLVGGTYFDYVVSKSGTDVADWTPVNQQNEVLPTVDNKKPINKTVSTDFDNFTTNVENFFPTLAGVTAQAHYSDNALTGLNITINTQFYGATELNSFTQYVANAASKYLPSGVKIEITIQSTQGIQAFVSRESSSKDFYTHVFGSY